MKKNAVLLIISLYFISCRNEIKENRSFPQAIESNDYAALVRNNAAIFHKNFNAGDFDKNGELVTEKIYVNSNNTIVIGRENFVNRINRFKIPFPTLKLQDRIIIVDENQVGLLYVMQGVHEGPYGSIPASGNKINVNAAEFFTMDDNARMKELLTITQLDQLKRQIKGEEKVGDYEEVKLLSTKTTKQLYKNKLKNSLDAYVQNFNTRDWNAFAKMYTDNASININGHNVNGAEHLIHQLKKRIAMMPDITYHLVRNIVEGDRGAIAYEVTAKFHMSGISTANVKSVSKTIMSTEGIHFQFDDKGKITNALIVYNTDDLKN